MSPLLLLFILLSIWYGTFLLFQAVAYECQFHYISLKTVFKEGFRRELSCVSLAFWLPNINKTVDEIRMNLSDFPLKQTRKQATKPLNCS